MNDITPTPLSARNLVTFNYDCLDKKQANTLRKTAAHIRKTGHDAFLEIGRELLQAKEWLDHGQFVQWVESECYLGIRTAQRAMQAAQVVAKNDKLTPLAVDALVVLSNARPELVEYVEREIGDGRIPTTASIKRHIEGAGNGADDAARSRAPEQTNSDMSASSDKQPNETLRVPTLDQLTDLWERADDEIKTEFRQRIGCPGDFAESPSENAA